MDQLIKAVNYMVVPIDAFIGLLCGMGLAGAIRLYRDDNPTLAMILAGVSLAYPAYRCLGRWLDLGSDRAVQAMAREQDATEGMKRLAEIEASIPRWTKSVFWVAMLVGCVLALIWSPLTLLGLFT